MDRCSLAVDAYEWKLLYTKVHAEAWAEANLKRQGFATVLPRTMDSGRTAPLFKRYIFVGHEPGRSCAALRGTFGVQYVVHCGTRPAFVSPEVISGLLERMDERGLIRILEKERNAIFSKNERTRIRALLKLSEAGYRVRIA